MKKKWIIIALVAIVLIFGANIILAAVWRNEATNIFTAVSGWISGIATAALGGIAFWQSKKHQEESSKQAFVQLLITQKKDFDDLHETFVKRKTLLDMINEYKEQVPRENQTEEILADKIDLQFVRDELRSIELTKAKLISDINFDVNKPALIEKLFDLQYIIITYFFEAKNVLDLSYAFHRFDSENEHAILEFAHFICEANALLQKYLTLTYSEIIKDQNRIKKENKSILIAAINTDNMIVRADIEKAKADIERMKKELQNNG